MADNTYRRNRPVRKHRLPQSLKDFVVEQYQEAKSATSTSSSSRMDRLLLERDNIRKDIDRYRKKTDNLLTEEGAQPILKNLDARLERSFKDLQKVTERILDEGDQLYPMETGETVEVLGRVKEEVEDCQDKIAVKLAASSDESQPAAKKKVKRVKIPPPSPKVEEAQAEVKPRVASPTPRPEKDVKLDYRLPPPLKTSTRITPETPSRKLEDMEERVEMLLSSPTVVSTDSTSTLHSSSRVERSEDIKRFFQGVAKPHLPTLTGERGEFQDWWEQYNVFVHQAEVPVRFKMVMLKNCLEGAPLELVKGLGYSEIQYEMAIAKLQERYGGERRMLQQLIEGVTSTPSIREENLKCLSEFSNKLYDIVAKLKDAGQHGELEGTSALYTIVLQKIPDSLLIQYQNDKYRLEKDGLLTFTKWLTKQVSIRLEMAELKEPIKTQRHDSGMKGSKRGDQRPNRSRAHATETKDSVESAPTKPDPPKPPKESGSGQSSKPSLTCPICQEKHIVPKCEKWQKASVQDRWGMARTHNICFRCLFVGHRGKACKSTKKCDIAGCAKTHHRSLHSTFQAASEKSSREPPKANSSFGISKSGKVVPTRVGLRVVPVNLISKGGHKRKVHAFLDDGSDSSYIRTDVARSLGLIIEDSDLTISTLTEPETTVASGFVALDIESLDGKTKGIIGARTLDNMCEGLTAPDWTSQREGWNHLRGIEFPKVAGHRGVDVLIGADHPELTLTLEERVGEPGQPVARRTPLGWTCVGPMQSTSQDAEAYYSRAYCSGTSQELQLDEAMRKLWNMDVVEGKSMEDFTPEEKLAVDKVSSSLKYIEGRYQVSIPWKEDRPSLPDNRPGAEKRLKSLEANLQRRPEVAERYSEVFDENLRKGYIREVPRDEVYEPGWYLPHFGVIKEDRATTKVRVVYDGAAVYAGKSLNDQMLPGPKLQQDIVDVLITFRKGAVALVGDIKEMFSQVALDPEDYKFHRILWQGKTYESVRLPFGDRASPFLAQFVVRTHAERHREEYPLASETCLKNLYMDDALQSKDTVELVKSLRRELSELLEKAGLTIRKWCSNSVEVLLEIPEEDRAPGIVDLEESELPCLKPLGVLWSAEKDVFSYRHTGVELEVVTKRATLSLVARLFDPLQLLAPYVIRAKIVLQEAWIDGLEWDEPFPDRLAKKVREWVDELPSVELFEVPRCYSKGTPIVTEVHTFTDASSLAYGAVVYIRNRYADGSVTVRIVIAKARVTPLKAVSIPRLELMAAVLGFRLALKVKELLGLTSLYFWTDSMDVVHWVHGQSRRYKPFVSHRIAEIQEGSSPQQWRHVPGSKNPADLASRGARVKDLTGENLWTDGPAFLYLEEKDWPAQKDCINRELSEEALEEVPKSQSHATISEPGVKDPSKYLEIETLPIVDCRHWSSMTRLVRVTAWVFRFIKNLKNRVKCSDAVLQVSELDEAEKYWVREAQRETLGPVIRNLKENRACPASNLKPLMPFLDKEGFVRVGGRLQNSDLPFDVRHPYLIPQQSHIALLIVRRAHCDGKHVRGVNATLADLRQRYWVVHGREELKKCERGCIICLIRKKLPHKQVMAPLPAHRVTVPLRAFARIGVDYAGPYLVKITRRVNDKRWLCLFTCTTSRAVHLEVAYSLDTDGFLHAFSRMVARRGKPELVVSDNGTNFVGAERELGELVRGLDQCKIIEDAANRSIEWKFNPPYGSHHGGLFEALVKSSKKALKAILGEARLTDEELLTAVVEVEGILNSRPLTYCSDDPKDETVLTPNHFLVGQAGSQLAPRVLEDVACNPRHRWKYIQQLVTQIWRRWNKEFLSLLQTRGKWLDIKEDLDVGDVVLVADPSNPKGKWPLGRVVETYPCQDSHVRSVLVKSRGKTFVRPISKLCPLNVSNRSVVVDTSASSHGGESVETGPRPP